MTAHTTTQLLSTLLSVEFYNAGTVDTLVSNISTDTLSAIRDYISGDVGSIESILSTRVNYTNFSSVEELKTDGSETNLAIIEKINELLGKLRINSSGTIPSPVTPPEDPDSKTVVTYKNGTIRRYNVAGELLDSKISNVQDAVEVKIGNTVTRIGHNVFNDCSYLSSITIPNSVTSTGEAAFSDCTSLTSIAIPASLTNFADVNPFAGCSNLESIIVDPNNTVYDSRNNCNAIIKTAENKLITGCKNTVIPNDITSVGEAAFTECYGLTAITIPNSVSSIGHGAFYFCNSLSSIVIPDGVKLIERHTFYNCSQLTSITIPNGVACIGESAFEGCTNLPSITLPDSVAELKPLVFSRCSNLSSITMLTLTAPKINDNTFGVSGNYAGRNSYSAGTNVLRVIQGSTGYDTSASEYGWNSLLNSTRCGFHIAYIEHPSYPKTIAHYSDGSTIEYGLSGILNSGDINDTEHLVAIEINGVSAINDHAFSQAVSTPAPLLSSVTLGTMVRSIGEMAFEGCSSLSSITIPHTITSIGGWAFAYSNLQSIIIPNSVETVEEALFDSCSNLSSVIFEGSKYGSYDGVKTLKSRVFDSCNVLSVEVPRSVTNISADVVGSGHITTMAFTPIFDPRPAESFVGRTHLDAQELLFKYNVINNYYQGSYYGDNLLFIQGVYKYELDDTTQEYGYKLYTW